ncbi:hypothetical protein HYO25_03990 [Vibrio parahaemolyticus]|uniref:hypothetical protein n=1 Tax=Vibrio parahaemolyticus TaxID=670 RepID=UPI0006A60CC0|nr:hypothetical protein [Vibrio parahaemolyticus]EGQ9458314.1 hypothetical protein [Vibrio parahaemolyticus]KOC97558.1 hypothetical protein ACS82_19065 [Vibrio parahaemolyticus]MBM4951707.1 hypothetical protein [Vibrio parahaemolyticus]
MNKSILMTKSFLHMLSYYPQSFSDDILNDECFVNKSGIKLNYNIIFSEGDVQFEDDVFYVSLLELYRCGYASITDESGKVWELSFDDNPNDAPIKNVLLISGDYRMSTPDFWFVHPDLNLRVDYFEYLKEGLLLGKSISEKMYSILRSEVSVKERMAFVKESINTSPGVFYSNLIARLRSQSSLRPDQLVPESWSYYESLIGKYNDSTNVVEYFNNEGFEHIKYLLDSYGREGLFNILCLNWHPHFSNEKIISIFDIEELDDLIDHVDVINCSFLSFSLADIFLKITREDEHSINFIHKIVESLEKDDVQNTLSLLSFFFILTDARLIRSKLFDSYPIFYRRLASLSQASLLYRCFCENGIDEVQKLCDWIGCNFGQDFYIGNLLNLRSDSRWLADYAEPEQLRNELLGRLLNSIAMKEYIKRNKYVEINSQASTDLPFNIEMFLPGPLEGGIEPREMPPYIKEIVDEGLASSGSTADSFTAFMNSSRYWKLDDQYLTDVAEKIRSSGHMFENIESIELLHGCLNGLAVAASVTKSELLADELLILTRVYRIEFLKEKKLQELVYIGVLASGSFSNITSWCKYLGQYLSELTYLNLDYEERQKLYYLIKAICNLEPRLFTTVSKAYVLLEEQCR